MIFRTTWVSVAVMVAIAAIFCTQGFASDKADAKQPPATGPAWADTKQNGQLTDKEVEKAEEYLKSQFGKYAEKTNKTPKRKSRSKR